MLYVAAETDDARAGGLGRADFFVCVSAHPDDVLHVAEGLDVVDDGGAQVEAQHGGKVGRLDARIGALALKALDEAGFLTTDVGAGAAMHPDVQVVATAEDVFAEVTLGPGLVQGAVQDFCALGKFAPDINVGEVHVVCPGGEDHALDELMRILVDDLPILKGARL